MADKEYTHNFRAPKELAWRKSYTKKPEITEKYRSEFMRARDRIMYCRSFRRLAGKTQIYRAGENDHQRTRLTHTLEVAQIARTVAKALHLDFDLAEAIALGHDLGHAPFGHAGEKVLHRLMKESLKDIKDRDDRDDLKDLFGFKHNIQSVRIVAKTDNSYGENGLDLTNFTLWGIMHHSDLSYHDTEADCPYKDEFSELMKHHGAENGEAWSFEAFVVKQADEIAQWHHDLEDALRGNAMTSKEVCEIIAGAFAERWKGIQTGDNEILKELKEKEHVDQKYLTQVSHIVIGTLVDWLVEVSEKNLALLEEKYKLSEKPEDEQMRFFKTEDWKCDEIYKAIGFEELGNKEKKNQLQKLEDHFSKKIHEKIHHSQSVERMNAKGEFVINRLFKSYKKAPQQLPTNILIMYLLELKEKEKEKVWFKINGDDPVKSWDEALKNGSGAVRICFNEVWEKAEAPQRILLMRKICDHISGMTDHFALEEYKNLYG